MKTTLNLPDAVVFQAKRRALEEGTTLTELIVQGLKARLEKLPRPGPLPLSRSTGGLKPGLAWEDLEAAEDAQDAYR
jgi:hypothetical protein